MSIHGCCYDEGQSGNCGLECECFLAGECDIADEIIEIHIDELTEGLLIYKMGLLRFKVAIAQTKIQFNKKEIVRKMIESGEAYEYIRFEY